MLALMTALLYGGADFAGGIASQRRRVLEVVLGAHLIGAVGATLTALALTGPIDLADSFDDLALGALGGLFGLIGVGLLYRRLAIGPMSVVAPITAMTAAVLPAAWGLAGGERLTTLSFVGLAAGLSAVLLVSLTSESAPADEHQTPSPPVTVQVVVEALLAGAGFGAFFVALDATDDAVAPWPVAGARIVTSAIMVVVAAAVARRPAGPVPASPQRWTPATAVLVAVAGLADTGANITFIYATGDDASLAVVSVLAALYPVATVALAHVVLSEQMTGRQRLGFGAAIFAAAALAAG